MEDRRFTEFKGNFITDNLKNKTALVERAFKTGGLFSDAGYIWENVHNLETNECPECGEDCTPFFFFREDEDGDTIVKCTSCGCEFYEPEFKHPIKLFINGMNFLNLHLNFLILCMFQFLKQKMVIIGEILIVAPH